MEHTSDSTTTPAEPDGFAPAEPVEALESGIERGHHLALVAAEGAGLGRLYATAAAHDLADAPDGRALIVAATDERVRRLGRTVHRAVRDTGLETIAWGPRTVTGGDILVGTPARVLADLRGGRLSLPDVRLLVLDDARALEPDAAAVEALLQLAGDDTRVIAATHARNDAFDDLIVRRLPRARRWPAELFATDDRAAPSGPPLRIASAAPAGRRIERVVDLLHDMAGKGQVERVVVWCARSIDTGTVETALAIEGFALGGEDAGVRVAGLDADVPVEGDAAILLGLPGRAADLERALAPADRRMAVVAPRHVRQLELLAERLGWPHRGLGDRPTAHLDEVSGFRSLIEEAVDRLDLASAMLLIEPLVERHGFHAVAAALAALLRETGRLPASPETAAPAPGAGPRPGADAKRATRPTWTRVFVNIGKQDGVSPGDLVGAITGETSAAGAQIGKIDIKPRFSLIDIDSMIVDDVVRALGRARIKGRDVTARLDRGG